jgi:hypothetical protein
MKVQPKKPSKPQRKSSPGSIALNDYWCNLHQSPHKCACPPIDQWIPFNPYFEMKTKDILPVLQKGIQKARDSF